MTKSLAHTVNLPYEPDSFTIEDLEKAIQELRIDVYNQNKHEDLFDLDLHAGVPHG